uniref:Uncharacterized protein n=1 Tax=Anguilla anguilla TaxID=7936 RepID=A0A0E9S0D2_ANGAN
MVSRAFTQACACCDASGFDRECHL